MFLALHEEEMSFIFDLNPHAMKKLVAAGCCIFLLQSFSKVSPSNDVTEKSAGRKVLIKAIAVIVNTEAVKKLPAKRIFIACSEPPLV